MIWSSCLGVAIKHCFDGCFHSAEDYPILDLVTAALN